MGLVEALPDEKTQGERASEAEGDPHCGDTPVTGLAP